MASRRTRRIALAALVLAVLALIPLALDRASATRQAAVPRAAVGSEFGVPSAGSPPGPYGQDVPACRPAQIRAKATGQRSVYGVLAVIHLTGTARHRVPNLHSSVPCPLALAQAPVALLDYAGRPLAVPQNSGQPSMETEGSAVEGGNAIVGLAWLGSYCGPRAASIRMPLSEPAGAAVRVPYDGPSPPCTDGQSDSKLYRGATASPGEPVDPPPPAWNQLRLTLHAGAGTTTRQLGQIKAILTNVGKTTVYLSPCPWYSGWYDANTRANGGFGSGISNGQLACTHEVTAIAPGRPYTFRIPPTKFNDFNPDDPDTVAAHGSSVKVDAWITGIRDARLDVPVP